MLAVLAKPSSFTFNFDCFVAMTWKTFWTRVVFVSGGLTAAIFATILVVDPYDALDFSPGLRRAPVASNQRFSYPAIARTKRFDSVVIGTSTSALLWPATLNRYFEASFANLAIASGTAYEQSRLLQLFVRHRTRITNVIFGVDETVWCVQGSTYPQFTGRQFPEWMYDNDPWNDLLNLYNLKSLENVGRQFGYLAGWKSARFGPDGTWDFLPPPSEYDVRLARKQIYGSTRAATKRKQVPTITVSPSVRASWTYPAQTVMASMLASLPASTNKIVVFVPIHRYLLPADGSMGAAKLHECKRRLTIMAARVPNAVALDFMIESAITRLDENYWDGLHYRRRIAEKFARLVAMGAHTKRGYKDLFKYLTPNDLD